MLTPVTEIPANAGVIIEAAEGNYKVPLIESAAALTDNDLLVSDGTVEGNGSTIYVLANGSNGVGFYLLAQNNTVPAGKAYLVVTGGGAARQFIGFDSESTGIKTVKAVEAEDAIYNLAGQRLTKAQKGLNIINGKVVLVK